MSFLTSYVFCVLAFLHVTMTWRQYLHDVVRMMNLFVKMHDSIKCTYIRYNFVYRKLDLDPFIVFRLTIHGSQAIVARNLFNSPFSSGSYPVARWYLLFKPWGPVHGSQWRITGKQTHIGSRDETLPVVRVQHSLLCWWFFLEWNMSTQRFRVNFG